MQNRMNNLITDCKSSLYFKLSLNLNSNNFYLEKYLKFLINKIYKKNDFVKYLIKNLQKD